VVPLRPGSVLGFPTVLLAFLSTAARSQIFTVLSKLAEVRCLLSGLNATRPSRSVPAKHQPVTVIGLFGPFISHQDFGKLKDFS
jgi:hypothetical protein